MVTTTALINQPSIQKGFQDPEMIISSKRNVKETAGPKAVTSFLNMVILSGELQTKPEVFELEEVEKKTFEKYLKITLLTKVTESQKELHVLAVPMNEADQYKNLKVSQAIYVNGYLKSGLVREQGKLKYQPVVIVKSSKNNINNP